MTGFGATAASCMVNGHVGFQEAVVQLLRPICGAKQPVQCQVLARKPSMCTLDAQWVAFGFSSGHSRQSSLLTNRGTADRSCWLV